MGWHHLAASLLVCACTQTVAPAPNSRANSDLHVAVDAAVAPEPDVQSLAQQAEAAARAYLDSPSRVPGVTVLNAARSLEQACAPAVRSFPGYQGRPVARCTYTLFGLSGVAYMLNADSGRIARWVGAACADISTIAPASCGESLARHIVRANGAQFIVAGVVVEHEHDAGGTGPSNDPIYLEFRDGVTVVTQSGLHWRKQTATEASIEASVDLDVSASRNYARIADANRSMYRLAGGRAPVGATWRDDPRSIFLAVSREAYLGAWDGHAYTLLNGRARAMRDAGQLR